MLSLVVDCRGNHTSLASCCLDLVRTQFCDCGHTRGQLTRRSSCFFNLAQGSDEQRGHEGLFVEVGVFASFVPAENAVFSAPQSPGCTASGEFLLFY